MCNYGVHKYTSSLILICEKTLYVFETHELRTFFRCRNYTVIQNVRILPMRKLKRTFWIKYEFEFVRNKTYVFIRPYVPRKIASSTFSSSVARIKTNVLLKRKIQITCKHKIT